MHIHKIEFHTFATAKLFLVCLLDAAHTYIVASPVIRILLYNPVIDLAHITEQVACHALRIGTHRAIDRIEARETQLVESYFHLFW